MYINYDDFMATVRTANAEDYNRLMPREIVRKSPGALYIEKMDCVMIQLPALADLVVTWWAQHDFPADGCARVLDVIPDDRPLQFKRHHSAGGLDFRDFAKRRKLDITPAQRAEACAWAQNVIEAGDLMLKSSDINDQGDLRDSVLDAMSDAWKTMLMNKPPM